MTPDTAALRALVDTYVTGWYLTAAEVRALCDAADEVERLRADRDALREQVRRLRASRESNRGGWERTLAERDALRAAVDRVRALGERDGRDRLTAWFASNGVDQPDTVAVEAAAFVLAALESGNYGTPEWFSSIDKPLFPPSADAAERERRRTLLALGRAVDAEAAHAALVADLRALVGGDELVSQRAVNPDEYTRRTGDRVPSYLAFYQGAADLAAVIRALLDRHAPTTGETP